MRVGRRPERPGAMFVEVSVSSDGSVSAAAWARATSSRWTAEALPCQYANSTRISAVISNLSARRAPGCAALCGAAVASASHRHTVRSETFRHWAVVCT